MTSQSLQQLEQIPDLQQTIESRWTELHSRVDGGGLFRYQLTIERERVTDGRIGFLLQLNRKRTTERRKPDIISSVRPPFDPNRFHFNKIDSREILLEFLDGGTPVALLINNSPLTMFHALVVPERECNLPQVLTEDSLSIAVRLLLAMKNRDYRIGYNSPGALASVNHLHFHLMLINHRLYVENAPLTPLGNDVYRLDDHPAKAYCFLLDDPIHHSNFTHRIFALIDTLLERNIAHNLFLTWENSSGRLRALVYPRLRPCENKQVSPFNVAFCELSGFVPLGEEADYEGLDELRLEQYFQEAQGVDLYERLDTVTVEAMLSAA